ncbi:hypothetical protein MN0502_16650 [Arthrobacter sp. MN05-02]|nr:hypothetical protein MN0502_16650 [Arthrobacter sp. MN05-02]
MRIQNKLCLSLVATLSLVAGSASTATAHDEENPTPGLPAETGGYQPALAGYYEDVVFPACGTTITLRSGDVRDLYEKVRVKRDGTTVIKLRGDVTTDVIAKPGGDLPDGGFLDELDNSGRLTLEISADGSTIVEKFGGPSVIYPVSETDAAALAAAGFPEFGYFERGKVAIRTVLTEDEAAEPVSTEVLQNTTRDVVDLCRALKESAGHPY